MRNLKKVLALVVAVAMIASMGLVASAASYSDVASNASYADAVNLLSNLGIITGYEDGSFKPANTVTRAEAATMIVRMLGLADSVEMGETMFTDVAADNWASGYVNVAVANGIVNGMGDGTFAPNGEVTYGQIVKMIVCALGYEPVAQANGGWNGGGYILAGSKAGFTKGVSGTADAAASRATVAQLIYNALEVELMDQKSWSTGINGSTFEVLEGQTILTEYLGLEKVEGVVVETYLSNVADYDADANTVTLVVTKNSKDADAEDIMYEVGETFDFVVTDAYAASLLGYTVTAYAGENEDDENAIFAIAEKAGKNSTVVVDTEDIVEFNEETIKYWKSSKATTEADIETFVKCGKDNEVEVENYQVVNGFNVYDEESDVEDILDVYATLEEITLLDNDGDGNFEFIFATIPSDNAVEFVVDEVSEEENCYYVDPEEGEGIEIDYEDEDKIYTVVKDGAVVDASAIVEGDVVTVLDPDLAIVTVYVSSNVVEGAVEEIDDEYYVINGKEYKLTTIADVTAPDAGAEGLFYINASGKIAALDLTSDGANADYVYVIDADVSKGDFGAQTHIVKVVTATGEIKVLTIKEKKCVIDGVKNQTDDDVYAAVENYVGLAKIDLTAAGELAAIYFPAEDGEFDALYAYDKDEDNAEYNEARGRYGKAELTSDMLVFHVDSTEIEVDEDGNEDYTDAITVTTVGNLFVDGNSYTFTAFGEEEEITVLVANDAKAAIDDEAPVMVVTKVTDTTADDADTIKITGVKAGETVSVIVDPDDFIEMETRPVKGNVILYAENAGYATDVKVLFTSDAEGVGELTGEFGTEADDEAVTVYYGEVVDVKTKSFLIGEEEAEFYFAADYNVTVVDYTGNKVTIAKGSKSSVKASTEKYTRTVFVKTALESEDEVTDIVVFVEKVDAE